MTETKLKIRHSINGRCDGLMFCAFIRKHIEQKMTVGRYGTAKTYNDALRSFSNFRGGEDVPIQSLTWEIMDMYEAWLKGRGLRLNSSSCYMRTLRTLYRKAVEMELTENNDIFRQVFTGFAKTPKRAIPLVAIKNIKNLDLAGEPSLAFARDMFLFSFYMQGMSFVDMAYLKKTDLRNGCVNYIRKKTQQPLEVVWNDAMQDIADRYSVQVADSPYLLPIITKVDGTERKQYMKTEQRVNRHLKQIAKMAGLHITLTTYVARHSWASLAHDTGFPLSLISRGMGHDNIKTTEIYLSQIDTSAVARANSYIIEMVNE